LVRKFLYKLGLIFDILTFFDLYAPPSPIAHSVGKIAALAGERKENGVENR
jgi:hypothetical protein